MGEVGPVSWVGFMFEGTCACVLVGGSAFFPSDGQGQVRWCLLGCLWEACLLMIGLCFCFACCWVRYPVLGAAGNRVLLSLDIGGAICGRSPWGQEFSSVPYSTLPLQRLRPYFWSGSQDLTSWLLCQCCCCWVTSVLSDSVRPHGWQPTRLLCPWDSPGKNTVIKGIKTNKNSETKNEPQTNGKSKIRQIKTKTKEHIHTHNTCHTHMKPKHTKENKVQESDLVNKGHQK